MKRVLCICPCFKRLVFIFLFSQIHHNFAQSYGGNAVGHSDILKANQMVNEGNKEEGFKLMKATADLGNSDAMYAVSFYYLYGIGVEKSESLYKKYFRASFDKDNPTAIDNVVRNTESRFSRNKYNWLISEREFEVKLLELASKDYPLSKFLLGKFYSDRSFIDKALYWYEKYADSEQVHFFYLLEAGENLKRLFLDFAGDELRNLDPSLEKKMENIFLKAQAIDQDSWQFYINVILGEYYGEKEVELKEFYELESISYVPKFENAEEFFLKAIEDKGPASQFFYYLFLKNTLKNYDLAKGILIKGMETNCVECQIEFALIYESSPSRTHKLLLEAMRYEEGFLSYYSSAKQFFDRADTFRYLTNFRARRYGWALSRLGHIYYSGIGVNVDKNEALKWFIKAREDYGETSNDDILKELGYFK